MQIDAPQQLYDHPTNVFVGGFIGSPSMNFFDVTVKGSGDKLTVDGDAFQLAIPAERAKGLKPSRILLVHALKPSSLTLVTVTGINIGRLIGGTVIVESIFALPGIGRLLLSAIFTRDLIILQGVVLIVALGYVLINFIVDLLYAVLDPRIRHGHA